MRAILIGCVIVAPVLAQQNQKRAEQQAKQFIQRHDKNNDQKLSREEFPERNRRLFPLIDVNKDGFITLQEDLAFRLRRVGQRNPRLPNGIKAYRDLTYVKVDGKSLLLDVYAPEKSEKRLPLIVWVHGGGWRAGSKNRCPALPYLSKGYVVASINYRLSQEAIYPAQIQDCKAAIRWLRANAKQYHINPERIGAWGSSAGGHLVALLGTTGDVEAFNDVGGHRDVSSRVQAVVDFFGPTDFLQMDSHSLKGARLIHNAANSPESKLIGGPIQKMKDKVQKANPITYVSREDPPFLILHGDKDPLVPWHQSKILFEALKEAKVPVRFELIKGAGHGFGGRKEVNQMVEDHFRKYLQGK